jgi:hypothetical protein
VAHDKTLFPDSPLKNLFCLRPVDPDSGSLRSLDRAATLVQNCVGNHQQCSDGNAVVLPSRVLDVKEDGNIITLLDKISIAGRNGKYACLSYCVSPSSNKMSLSMLKSSMTTVG